MRHAPSLPVGMQILVSRAEVLQGSDTAWCIYSLKMYHVQHECAVSFLGTSSKFRTSSTVLGKERLVAPALFFCHFFPSVLSLTKSKDVSQTEGNDDPHRTICEPGEVLGLLKRVPGRT